MKTLDGYKTFLGIAALGIAYLGWTDYITPEEWQLAVQNLIALVGIVMSVYGRLVAAKRYVAED